MKLNGKVIGVVGGVASAATVVATAVAARQVPVLAQGDGPVAPIRASSPAPSAPATTPPATTPTATPTAKPVLTPRTTATPPPSTPTRLPRGPAQITVDPGKLERGEAPRVPYSDGLELNAGDRKATIDRGYPYRVVSAGDGIMAVVSIGQLGRELQMFDSAGRRTGQVPDVRDVRSSDGGGLSAYATGRLGENGAEVKGSTITWRDNKSGRTVKLSRPDDYEVEIFKVDSERVYFGSKAAPGSVKATLYEWWIRSSTASRLPSVPTPTAVSALGSQAAALVSLTDSGSCTEVVASYGRERYWRTCDYQVDAFSPDGGTVIAGPAYRDGYADTFVAVLDNSNGKLIRQWKGVSVMSSAYEDDDHILFVAEKGSRGAIVRCTVSTGTCELATPFVEGRGAHSVGNPYQL
jgi:hypothetical protein